MAGEKAADAILADAGARASRPAERGKTTLS
jgi:hypothetical protein